MKFVAKAKEIFMQQLKQGATPQGLALTVAMGMTLSTVPVFGATTGLCILVAAIMKLNQPVIQVANYAAAPAQILLFPVFLKSGAWLCNVPAVSLNPLTVFDEFKMSPMNFLSLYGMAVLQAVLVWLIAAPIAAFILYRVSLLLFRRYYKVTAP